jgi:hypothetical protein
MALTRDEYLGRRRQEEPRHLIADEDGLEAAFRLLARQWRNETAILSSPTRITAHPAYRAIIGLGSSIVPLILREIQYDPYEWLWTLREITGQDPAKGLRDIDQAVAAWLAWGRNHQLIDDASGAHVAPDL